MPTPHLVRDSFVGKLVNHYSSQKFARHPEEKPGYVLPDRYKPSSSKSISLNLPILKSDSNLSNHDNFEGSLTSEPNSALDSIEKTAIGTPASGKSLNEKSSSYDEEKVIGKVAEQLDLALKKSQKVRNHYLVDYEENDQDDPRNWSKNKKIYVAFLISLLTFSIYIGSAIYTASIPGIIEQFNVSLVVATLGLTLFVFAYGIGPLILCPLQEMKRIGRNGVYIPGLFLFVLFQMPAVLPNANIATIMVFRFLSGFVGSPAMATGGASMGDIYGEKAIPYAIGIWSLGAVSGPVFGPVVGGYAAQFKGWEWTFFELMWLSGVAFILLAFTFPETLNATILHERAVRIRKFTGDDNYKTQAEMDLPNGEPGFVEEALEGFYNVFRLAFEPAILFANTYIGIVYAFFYLWFESFPIVFIEIYGFGLGASGLPFLGFIVSGVICFFLYAAYQYYHLQPRLDKTPKPPPEIRLELALMGSVLIPISVLMFGWGARENVSFMVPIIGAALYLPGIYIIFQCILVYVTDGYQQHYAASILAGNDFFRSTFASFFPLFGSFFFIKLGLGPACSLLAGVSTLMIPLLWYLMRNGEGLRARSKFTKKAGDDE